MKKTHNTSSKIISYIQDRAQATPKELAENIEVSLQMIHRSLKKLVSENLLKKRGSAPHVYYSLSDKKQVGIHNAQDGIENNTPTIHTTDEVLKTIEDTFYTMTPDGQELFGIEAFGQWCAQRKYNISQKAKEYVEVYRKYNSREIEKEGLDATSKILSTFQKENRYLDELIYLYPYSLPVFGKTKISEMLFTAKQTQDEKLMKKAFELIREKILHVIKHIKPDAIGFVPPTLMRKKQIMKELQVYLNLHIPLIRIEKIKTPITVQQKTLKQIEDRILNADKTMVVLNTKVALNTKQVPYKKVLIIDDFTGSGATLNEIAKKIKNQKIAKTVIGLTLTGSLNGFDVVREV